MTEPPASELYSVNFITFGYYCVDCKDHHAPFKDKPKRCPHCGSANIKTLTKSITEFIQSDRLFTEYDDRYLDLMKSYERITC